jgi:hypothetical protein
VVGPCLCGSACWNCCSDFAGFRDLVATLALVAEIVNARFQGPGSSAMEVYKTETRKVIKRFLRNHLSFDHCIQALDAALGRLIPRMNQEDFPALRALMLANNEIVMSEMERRTPTCAL